MGVERCPECGSSVSGDAPGALCPRCLLAQGFRRRPDVDPDASTCDDPLRHESTPSHIGPYQLLQVLGEGGMGRVYLAEQTEPFRRRVALKVIKLGMDTRQVIARFEAERQALALMDHPSIARVYDAGVTTQGSPYFAMEYVKGEPITTYCDRHRSPTRERLELFRKVCDGVQHAHHKAVIHRDLKASNVLVTVVDNEPVPKIIDFGVAKAISHRLTEQTLFTEIGVLVGTPEYMSPEQADLTALDVDTRTDVYSLGVLLYELLTGTLPFDSHEMRAGGYDEVRRRIREEEPIRPSARLSTLANADQVARSRHTDPRTLTRRLRRDLDWITMRALEKDRTRRYDSPAELGADIGRHLNHEPVAARRPSLGYRLGTLVRRHKVGAAMTAALVAALLIATVGTTVGMVRARRAERVALEAQDVARREADTATQVTEFLVGLFEEADPGKTRGREVTVGEVLDHGSARIERQLEGQPLVRARLLNTMSRVYVNLGDYDRAGELARQGLDIRRARAGQHADVADSLEQLGSTLFHGGRSSEALRHLEQALEIRLAVLGPDHEDTGRSLYLLGVPNAAVGEYDKAEQYLQRALPVLQDTLGPESELVAWCHNDLGVLRVIQERYADSLPHMEKALEIKRRLFGPGHPDVLNGANNVGYVHAKLGNFETAEPYLLEAVRGGERVLGRRHSLYGGFVQSLGELRYHQGRYEEALQHLREALEIHESAGAQEQGGVALSLEFIGKSLRAMGNAPDAAVALRRSLEMREERMGPDDPALAPLLEQLAEVLEEAGDEAEATRLRARLP